MLETCIRRPVAVFLVTLGVLLLGLVAYTRLPIAALPTIDFPTIIVIGSLPGASPETMASALATPLERQFGTIGGLDQMTSVNTLGSTTIILQFDLAHTADSAARDVEAAINAAEPNLPTDLPLLPRYFKANPNHAPVMVLAMTSDTIPAGKVYDLADTIVSERLSQVDGISQVQIDGAEKTAIRVQVDPGKLASMGISFEQVRAAIATATVNAPKGSFEGQSRVLTIGANDQLFSAAEYGRLVIAWRNGAPVRLADLGAVIQGVANTRIAGSLDGKPAIILSLRRADGANIVATVERVKAVLPQLREWLPPGVKLRMVMDRTQSIAASVADVKVTMLITTIIVVLVIAAFVRRFWATVIPSLAVPVSFAGTFAAMYLLDYSLDTMSMLALTIAIGFVIDDAIVIIENSMRLVEEGMAPLPAALKGLRQIGPTIVSITIVLLASLAPMLFEDGIQGRFTREFAVTIAIAIVISAVLSLTLTPTMCAQFLKVPRQRPKGTGLDWLIGKYLKSLETALGHPRLMIAATILMLPMIAGLFMLVPAGYIPVQQTDALQGSTESAPDISFAAMQARQEQVAKAILTDPAVSGVTSQLGPSFFGGGTNTGQLDVSLTPRAKRDLNATKVIDRLRPKLKDVPGIDTFLSPVQDFGFGARQSNAPYQFTVMGADLDKVQKWAVIVRDRMKLLPDLVDVSTDSQDGGLMANLTIDRDAAARLGVSPVSIDQTLYDAFGQRQIATIYTEQDQFKVVLEADPAFQTDPASLSALFVGSGTGKQVPLSAVTKQSAGPAPTQINHQGGEPAITVSFNTRTGVSLGTAMKEVTKAVAELHVPQDLTADFEGDAFAAKQSQSQQPMLLLAGLIAIYLVLGVLYESYAHPLTILSAIPSAAIGGLLAMIVTRTEFSVFAVLGIILLLGFVMKNGILMTDYALDAERRGMSAREAIMLACRLRFRPIAMTTLAATLGLLPVAIGWGTGSELRQPVGIVVIGGLLVNQFLGLYTTPVFYLAINRLRRRKRAHRAPADRSMVSPRPAS